ncbi:hypothetical protein FisN_11Lh175 [Fistulifera solaris]|uniref:Erythroid differentiation-related factor 1 n=1 Tax=Fistulifera solaris TaxID=1519565 RepID=A0A1Z5J773_FISSO|nr:hypothetical protein FisN_11Lh175 [Fistulifera solaris]|eukprot:GAX09847.1 hypothetical protein FisN_11Lh175 [Fistulifera solaris]
MSNSTLSLVPSAPKATAQVREGRVVEGTNNHEEGQQSSGEDLLDFIGSSPAFKQLFSLPYSLEQSVSVAVHNLGDTLLLDVDPGDQEILDECGDTDAGKGDHPLSKDQLSQALVTLSEAEPQNEAIALVHSLIESTQPSSKIKERIVGVPYPEDQITRFISTPNDPREYLSWKFRNMNLLVGSDAFVYRPPEDQAKGVSVRIEDVKLLQSKIQLHQEMQSKSEREKLSYAQVTARSLPQLEQGGNSGLSDKCQEFVESVEEKQLSGPESDQLRLQTCLVSSPSVPIGSLLSQKPVLRGESPSTNSSPISTVLDVYLDNIMANVPQLALCLQDKGFVQSVKLLNTDQIPSTLLKPSTIDTSIPFQVLNGADDSERIFSPEVMEMNASTLLGFLKAQCTKDNTTYLLRREAGETAIQLYDISAISTQRQQKWNWWLAMMSYRFAHRLRSLSTQTVDKALSRSFRARQRSLLTTSLELLDALADMNGKTHESLLSAIRENLADSFLGGTADDNIEPADSNNQDSNDIDALRHQPYSSVSLDALNKSHDHLVEGIRILWPSLERNVKMKKRNERSRPFASKKSSSVKVVSVDIDDDSSGDDENVTAMDLDVIDPVVSQLFGLHEKLVDVLLRLGEIHLQNYYSSSAMQTLRSAARRISDSLYLTNLIAEKTEKAAKWLDILQLQNAWLWEHCGHFARTFAMDELWRDRGHASGDDIVSVILDVDSALKHGDILFRSQNQGITSLRNPIDLLSENTGGAIGLDNLSGVVDASAHGSPLPEVCIRDAIELLNKQRLLQREHRRVLVISSIAYGRAIASYKLASLSNDSGQYLSLLQQRLGDACNETGKAMMDEVRRLLTAGTLSSAVEALLRSAEFWFREGLTVFETCNDLRNAALLRCNLCQCSKLRANAMLAPSEGTGNHAEKCLQEAVHQLQSAHQCLGQRDTDPPTWDMVSNELAATLLVLGVRRRQSLIGNLPVLVRRLSPGEERSVLEPMENALTIYERTRNYHQAAAVHYQLALFFTKIWTCQRDEIVFQCIWGGGSSASSVSLSGYRCGFFDPFVCRATYQSFPTRDFIVA